MKKVSLKIYSDNVDLLLDELSSQYNAKMVINPVTESFIIVECMINEVRLIEAIVSNFGGYVIDREEIGDYEFESELLISFQSAEDFERGRKALYSLMGRNDGNSLVILSNHDSLSVSVGTVSEKETFGINEVGKVLNNIPHKMTGQTKCRLIVYVKPLNEEKVKEQIAAEISRNLKNPISAESVVLISDVKKLWLGESYGDVEFCLLDATAPQSAAITKTGKVKKGGISRITSNW